MKEGSSPEPLALKDKIKHILEEARVILPGTQAILGFQLVAVFSNGFDRLPLLLKNIHVISLLIVTITTIMLLAIASFHRIAEKGKDTGRLNIFGSSMIEIALVTLVFGLALDMYVVIMAANKSTTLALAGTVVIILFALCMWFVMPIIIREKKNT